jgi:hypothetical protein
MVKTFITIKFHNSNFFKTRKKYCFQNDTFSVIEPQIVIKKTWASYVVSCVIFCDIFLLSEKRSYAYYCRVDWWCQGTWAAAAPFVKPSIRGVPSALQGGCAATRKHETASISLLLSPSWRYLFSLTRFFSLVCPQEKTAAGRAAAAGQFLLVPGWYCGFAHRQQHRWVCACVYTCEPLHVPLSKLLSAWHRLTNQRLFHSSLSQHRTTTHLSKHTSGAIIYLPVLALRVCVCCCVGRAPTYVLQKRETWKFSFCFCGWD